MLIIFLLRDDFERSKCILDPWLSCIFDYIRICVFLFLKNYFKAPWHLSIARWIDQKSFCSLDSSLTASSIHSACFAVDTSRHLLNSCICWSFLKLDTFQHLLSIENYWTPIYRVSVIRSSLSLISLHLFVFVHLSNLSHSLQTSFPRDFRPLSNFLHLVSV